MSLVDAKARLGVAQPPAAAAVDTDPSIENSSVGTQRSILGHAVGEDSILGGYQQSDDQEDDEQQQDGKKTVLGG